MSKNKTWTKEEIEYIQERCGGRKNNMTTEQLPTVEEIYKTFNACYKFLRSKIENINNINWDATVNECVEICKQFNHSSLSMALSGACYQYLSKLAEGKITK